MCGFVSYENATIREYPEWVDAISDNNSLLNLFNTWPDYKAYPAFGGDVSKTIPLLISENNESKIVNAVWWFDAFCEEQQTFLGKLTSFNARNLDSTFWKGALNHHRGIVLANYLGESKRVGKTKHQYLMQGEAPFLLGALYKKLANGQYCCAIITRDAHPKMTPYHDKAFPLFLPIKASFIDTWIGNDDANNDSVRALLDKPVLFPSLHVQRVKTYKGRQKIGQTDELLVSDLHSIE
jgi:putative SOS response-associated peptidase YedK